MGCGPSKGKQLEKVTDVLETEESQDEIAAALGDETDAIVEENHCGYCQHAYGADEDWIECSGCKHQFHKSCEITNDPDYEGYEDEEYFCMDCKVNSHNSD